MLVVDCIRVSGAHKVLVAHVEDDFRLPALYNGLDVIQICDQDSVIWSAHMDLSCALRNAYQCLKDHESLPTPAELYHAVNVAGDLVMVTNQDGLFLGWAAKNR